ncbi:MAG: hypothetical protein HLUCCA01_08820 [Bacteroidetes bacterium HLUCCA01]|nr:MAG: hypothetical protein HLUCCA01_08820 [Bacteroidetes bacterium HLUCCA01]
MENIRSDKSFADLAFQVLITWGKNAMVMHTAASILMSVVNVNSMKYRKW